MPYRYRGDIAVADIAFDAWGETLEEVFAGAAQATMQVMVEDLATIRPLQPVRVELEQQDPEMLLFDFLNDLVFYKDASRLFLLPYELEITGGGEDGCALRCVLRGETIDEGRHRPKTDVKAVTLHRFSLSRTPEGWRATVVLDV